MIRASELKSVAAIAVGTSSGHMLGRFAMVNQLDIKGSANSESDSFRGELTARFLDLGAEIVPNILRTYVAEPEQRLVQFYPQTNQIPNGASRVPPLAERYFEKLYAAEPLEWPLRRGVQAFFINISGGTGGGIAPHIVKYAPAAVWNIAIVNASTSGGPMFLNNFCYNFPRINLGPRWSWSENQRWHEDKGDRSRYYSCLALVDPEAVADKIRDGVIPRKYVDDLVKRINDRLQPEAGERAVADSNCVANVLAGRVLEMIIRSEHLDFGNFLVRLAASGVYPYAKYLVPFVWPLDEDANTDGGTQLLPQVYRAIRLGGLCKGVNPVESLAAIVLVEGTTDKVGDARKILTGPIAKELQLPEERVFVQAINLDARPWWSPEDPNTLRVCVLLLAPSFAQVREMSAPSFERNVLADGTDAWRFWGTQGIPAMFETASHKEWDEIEAYLVKEADPRLIMKRYQDWRDLVGRAATSDIYTVRSWGREPSDAWRAQEEAEREALLQVR